MRFCCFSIMIYGGSPIHLFASFVYFAVAPGQFSGETVMEVAGMLWEHKTFWVCYCLFS
jgi:hypothetical protein